MTPLPTPSRTFALNPPIFGWEKSCPLAPVLLRRQMGPGSVVRAVPTGLVATDDSRWGGRTTWHFSCHERTLMGLMLSITPLPDQWRNPEGILDTFRRWYGRPASDVITGTSGRPGAVRELRWAATPNGPHLEIKIPLETGPRWVFTWIRQRTWDARTGRWHPLSQQFR